MDVAIKVKTDWRATVTETGLRPMLYKTVALFNTVTLLAQQDDTLTVFNCCPLSLRTPLMANG